MAKKVDTLTTLTNTIIKHKTPKLTEIPDGNSDERYEMAMDITEEIIDSYVSQLSFVETMIFAQELCDKYDVAEAFPSEQRKNPLYSVDDWHEAATGGLYHLILESVRKEAKNNQGRCEKYERFPNRNSSKGSGETTKSEDGYNENENYTEKRSNLYKVIEYDLDRIKTIGDQIITDVIKSEKDISRPQSVQKLRNSNLIVKTLVINYITDQTEFYKWDGMSDTACREKFAYSEFTAVIDTVITEFESFYNPDDKHTVPNHLQE